MTHARHEVRALLRGFAFLSPWLIGFCLFTLLPVALSLYYSFCDYRLLQPPLLKGLANYRMLFNDDVFWKSVWNTAIYAGISLPLAMLTSLAVAMLLNSNIRGISIYRTIIFLPSLVPIVASAMIWLWLFNAELGLINTVLRGLGVSDPPGWLVDSEWAMSALILMSLWGIGNTVVIYLAGLQDVPRELYEAASLDGASPLRQIWHVTLPSISPVIFFNLIMGMIGVVQAMATPFILTGGGPDRATLLYTVHLYKSGFEYLNMGYASAMAWILLLVVLALTALVAWTGKRWVHYQGR
jgi:multiple sugar transport system permease protein